MLTLEYVENLYTQIGQHVRLLEFIYSSMGESGLDHFYVLGLSIEPLKQILSELDTFIHEEFKK